MDRCGLLEDRAAGGHPEAEQIATCPIKGLSIGECQPKLALVIESAPSSSVLMEPQVPVSAYQTAQVPSLVVVGPWRHGRKRACAHELVVRRQVRPAHPALLSVRDELPSSVGQKPVISACDELRSVLERYAVRRLAHSPVSEHEGRSVPAVGAAAHSPVHLISDANLLERHCRAIRHEDRRFTRGAKWTGMRTSSIRIDRPAKRHPANAVQDRFDFDGYELPVGHPESSYIEHMFVSTWAMRSPACREGPTLGQIPPGRSYEGHRPLPLLER